MLYTGSALIVAGKQSAGAGCDAGLMETQFIRMVKDGAMKIHIKRLDHVQLCIPTGEEAKARDFYGRVLGFNELEKPDELKPHGGLWFEVADIQLHIGVEAVVAKSKHHPAFEVEGLDEIRKYLRQQQVETREETPVAGQQRFSFFDPFGNRIELLERD
jgi:catechol 2,3-dioxygenase-like lactoylglutathione lyase family enzyme